MADLLGYIVVLPNTIIDIPLTSNFSWLPLFYTLPLELVSKQKKYESIPRNIKVLLSSPEYMKLIEDDVFLQLVWDSYAWSIWQFLKIPLRDGSYRDIPGDWSDYSGNFPLWRLCYYLQLHFRDKFEHGMEFSFQRLFMMPFMDGNELTAEIRKLSKDIPVLILTALEAIDDKEKGFNVGADDYLVRLSEKRRNKHWKVEKWERMSK